MSGEPSTGGDLVHGGNNIAVAQDGLERLSVGQQANGPTTTSTEIVPVGKAKTALPDTSSARVETHTRALGIIQPPPDLKAIVDKTASFVAKNGTGFEAKILEAQQGNPRFNFLRSTDPYHAYFRHAVAEELKRVAGDEPSDAVKQAADAAELAKRAAVQQPMPAVGATAKPLTPPPPDQYTVRTPEGLTAEHVDIIKLTAQCVARNGNSFLTGLVQREQGNPAFLFLKPTHSLSGYFRELCDAYSATLLPPKELLTKLKRDAADREQLLERCLNRLEWTKAKEAQDKAAADKLEAERIAMQSIDWHDFVVVETIDFFDDEDHELPGPMTQRDVVLLNRANAFATDAPEPDQEMAEANGTADVQMDDEEKAMIEEANASAEAAPQAKPQAQVRLETDDDQPMRIVKDYQRPAARPAGQSAAEMAVSPITGELVPLAQMAEHMRISLIDPQWRTQREAMLSKIREGTQASDDEISRNLVDLASHRPDVFGSSEEEVGAIVKASIDDKKITGNDRAVAWDGQTRSGPALQNQINAVSENQDSRKRKEPEQPSMPKPILGPKPTNQPTVLPPPPVQLPKPNALPPPPSRGPQLAPPPVRAPAPAPLPSMPPSRPMAPPLAPPPLPVLRPPPLPPAGLTPLPPSAPAPPPVPASDPGPPDAKRQRVDFVLQAESDFLQQFPGPSKVRILCPDEEANDSLNGQVLEVEVASLANSIGDLKARLSEVVSLPPNKQQLSREHFKTLRDVDSLAYYNVSPDVELVLSVKRRGGR